MMCVPTPPPASAVIKKKKSIAEDELFPGARFLSLVFIGLPPRSLLPRCCT